MWHDVSLLKKLSNYCVCLFVAIIAVEFAIWMLKKPMYALQMVKVQSVDGDSLHYVSDQTVRNAPLYEIKGTFVTVDINDVRTIFESVPWVRKASVRREWPDKLIVSIEEYQPLGTWGDEGKLLSIQGEVFTANVAEAEADYHLMKFDGPEGSGKEVLEQYKNFKASFAPLNLVPKEVMLSDRYAWSVKMENGLLVQFGRETENMPLKALIDRFLENYPRLIQKYGDRIGYVDMRYPSGMAIRLKTAVSSENTNKEQDKSLTQEE